MKDVETPTNEVEEKLQQQINKERRFQEASHRLISHFPANQQQQQRDAETQFEESTRRLDYLLTFLPDKSQTAAPNLTNIDKIRANVPLSLLLLEYRLDYIRHKLDVENRVLTGITNMLTNTPPNSRVFNDLTAKVNESKTRIAYLKKAESEWNVLVDVAGSSKTVETAAENMETMRLAELNSMKHTGRLTIQPIESLNLTRRRRNASTEPVDAEDLRVIIRIDGQVKGSTSSLVKEKWTEVLDIQVDRATEVELAVYDVGEKLGDLGYLLGMVWFKLHDLVKDLESKHTPSGRTIDGVKETWLDLIPGGRLCLKVNFSSVERVKSERNAVYRRDGVHKIRPINGHKFVSQVYYQVMSCGVCDEKFLGAGYQCENCQFFCHPKCYDRVFFNCAKDVRKGTTTSIHQQHPPTANKIKYNIPHRYKEAPCLAPTWCNHCGYIVGLTRRMLVCSECSFTVHHDHAPLVPPYCGLKWDGAVQIVAAMDEEEARRDAEEADRIRKEWEHLAKSSAQESEGASPVEMEKVPELPPRPPVAEKRQKRLKVTIEDFEFISVLGRGSFGKVMLAEDKVTKKYYAIKALKKDFVIQNDDVKSTNLEKRIFQAASATNHPFLVNLHSCFHSDTRLYFVMEYVSGGDLMAHIQNLSRKARGAPVGFGPERTKFYATEVLLALDYFHKNEIIYRDLKLENILMTADGHLKVADYGICKEKMAYGARTRSFCGTPEYMAPEILLHERYSRAVDWWSFGVLMYVMTVGKYPFPGDDENDILDLILADAIDYPPSIPRTTLALIQALLNKNPARRLGGGRQDADEVKKHLYFNGVDWDAFMKKRIVPPWSPSVKHPTDTSNFSAEYTRERPLLTHVESNLSQTQQEDFKDFAYVSPWAQNWG